MSHDASPFALLATVDGRALLEGLSKFDEIHVTDAAAFARARAPAALAAAALATTFARKRAASARKFSSAESLFFTREGYEQATSEAVAQHRAQRFSGYERVADLCCGIGADALALAQSGCSVTAVDLNVDALACARENAVARDVGDRVRTALADATTFDLALFDAAFADPSRRVDGTRVTTGADYSPPLAALLARAAELPGNRLAVKVAPGLRFGDLRALAALDGISLEVELVSERGTCKEAVLWCGSLARYDGARRATVIRDAGIAQLDGDPRRVVRPTTFKQFIGEPDPAVIRAGLIGELCAMEDSATVDARVAYITSDAPVRTAFARWFPLLEALPFNARRVRARLREFGFGAVVVKTRAFPLLPDQIRRLLDVAEGDDAVLICATLGGKKWALVCGTAEP